MVKLTTALAAEYDQLLSTVTVTPEHVADADAIVNRITPSQDRYEQVADEVGAPWYFVAVIHSLEAGLSFTRHLHNGDPLTARTTHVPAGRPQGHPPFTWEQSAADALTLEHIKDWHDWSVAGLLFRLEAYNGFGYRNNHPSVLSPYLWSFTNHYTRGKYVGDGKFDTQAVSKQCGAIALLHRMQQRALIDLDTGVIHAQAIAAPAIVFTGLLQRGSKGPDVCKVQARLRELGHAIDKVAGCPFGPQTKAAVIAFQHQHGLEQDGKVGKDTWSALFA